jgi:uroporphyrinogen decarboxylase
MPILDPEFIELTRGLDVDAFWEENSLCRAFTPDKPRCALSFSPDDHWLFEFFDIPSTLRYFQDKPYRDDLHRQANDLLVQYVGLPFFDEDTWETSPRRIENLFGCRFAYHEGSTPWLVPVTDDPTAFSRVLDEAERILASPAAVAEWALPEDFRAEWQAREAQGRALMSLGTGSRGPATVLTSVLRPETLFYWAVDHPALLARFRDLLAAGMLALNRALREFSGALGPGWWITDDNAALFNRRLYREYCFPVLRQVLDAFAPGDARRYQHSDSAVGHLLEMQYDLGIRAVNYGPTVDAGLIRAKMPEAYIIGQMPPFLLRNGSPEEIRAQVRSDFRKAGASGGLEIATAGSLAAGTGLGRMRWLMQVVQTETRLS